LLASVSESWGEAPLAARFCRWIGRLADFPRKTSRERVALPNQVHAWARRVDTGQPRVAGQSHRNHVWTPRDGPNQGPASRPARDGHRNRRRGSGDHVAAIRRIRPTCSCAPRPRHAVAHARPAAVVSPRPPACAHWHCRSRRLQSRPVVVDGQRCRRASDRPHLRRRVPRHMVPRYRTSNRRCRLHDGAERRRNAPPRTGSSATTRCRRARRHQLGSLDVDGSPAPDRGDHARFARRGAAAPRSGPVTGYRSAGRSLRMILFIALRGNDSTKTKRSGTLYFARLARQ
jgi:hypothetical protein